jgi:chemotaxis signal transduction protein
MGKSNQTINDLSKELSPGDYVMVKMGKKRFGVNIEEVGGVVSSDVMTPLHDAPEYLRGIISLNDKIIPVLDLGAQMNVSSVNSAARSHIIILETIYKGNLTTAGILVDEASRVISIHGSSDSGSDSDSGDLEHQYLAAQVATLTRAIRLLNTE